MTAAPVSAVSAEEARASVERLLADMAAENERRREGKGR
jgi:hypothetical protein